MRAHAVGGGHSARPTAAGAAHHLKRPVAGGGPGSGGREGREMRAKRNEWRITKMVLAIFLSFLCCYLPITIVKVADTDVRYPGERLARHPERRVGRQPN